MTDLTPFVPILAALETPPSGVAFNAPPPHLIRDAVAHVTAQMADVPHDAHGAIVLVGNRGPDGRPQVNAAIAVHGPRGVEVSAWIGKTWQGPIDYGVTGVKVF
jgi:hypothetical protein